eukprot:TRINITY_DN12549_c0_g1_i4.p2 TRINITY_DN12549_c0_g1~~TRINITY_DN12549_c0_g1_i4.p2  ORF type:complete len:159 (+),score=37.54 TRINITY_DN12549_c0_g1_i4:156-632(+)
MCIRDRTGPGRSGSTTTITLPDGPEHTVTLLAAGSPEAEAEVSKLVEELQGNVIAIDFTHPTAVNPNAEFYGKMGLPFIMGTTGGDRDALTTCTQATLTSSSRLSRCTGRWSICRDCSEYVQADRSVSSHDGNDGHPVPWLLQRLSTQHHRIPPELQG